MSDILKKKTELLIEDVVGILTTLHCSPQSAIVALVFSIYLNIYI